MQEFKKSYNNEKITSLDIILPPFLDLTDQERETFERQKFIEQQFASEIVPENDGDQVLFQKQMK